MIKVGTDIIEVSRIKDSIEKYGENFLIKVFTPAEISYCNKYKIKEERFAGKFAAKEATQKALMAAIPDVLFPLNKIEILNNKLGNPYILLLGEIYEYSQHFQLEVSISHIKKLATATTILVEK